jgi:large subunit ribosomal protein L10
MTVAQMTDFRKRMKEAGGSVKVAKNKLARLAVKDTDIEAISDLLTGQTCVAYSDDPVSAARISVKYSKENDKLVILGGAMGTTRLDSSGVLALAALPSLDELRGMLIGLLQAPASKIARVLNEPGAMLARVVAAKGAQEAESA